ncbi:MAG: PhnD/SsuA/transferrin family substrate-binding protein [Xenococcaceae cyanobacterium MO_188.B32]|nr:PhnD/SsuA/transferrin family substrate-binding protein [Xenococcaceae cyanobacterium MO_188.B32]
MLLRRLLGLVIIVLMLTGCNRVEEDILKRLIVGVVSYGASARSNMENYSELEDYLSNQLNSIIELEPAFNEIRASAQIAQQRWDLVFAPPGLAAIAIYHHRYEPIIPLEGLEKLRSVIVVNADSRFQTKAELAGETIALGQEGSATGYYLPIYNLYGLSFAEVRFAPTPKTSLEWLDSQEVAASALSLQEFNQHRKNYKHDRFRIIDIDSHPIPAGAILLANKIEPERKEQIKSTLAQTPSHIAASAGFLPNEQIPQYEYLVDVIERVLPISERIKEQPARLYEVKQEIIN